MKTRMILLVICTVIALAIGIYATMKYINKNMPNSSESGYYAQ